MHTALDVTPKPPLRRAASRARLQQLSRSKLNPESDPLLTVHSMVPRKSVESAVSCQSSDLDASHLHFHKSSGSDLRSVIAQPDSVCDDRLSSAILTAPVATSHSSSQMSGDPSSKTTGKWFIKPWKTRTMIMSPTPDSVASPNSCMDHSIGGAKHYYYQSQVHYHGGSSPNHISEECSSELIILRPGVSGMVDSLSSTIRETHRVPRQPGTETTSGESANTGSTFASSSSASPETAGSSSSSSYGSTIVKSDEDQTQTDDAKGTAQSNRRTINHRSWFNEESRYDQFRSKGKHNAAFRSHKTLPRFFWLRLCQWVLIVLVCGLIVQILFVHDYLFQQFVDGLQQKLIITPKMQEEDSTSYRNWISNACSRDCAKQYFTYTIFNITNPDEVMNGSYPKLEEVGPFVYRRYEYRKNVEFSQDGYSVNYTYEYDYQFVNDSNNNDNYEDNDTYDLNHNVTVLSPFWVYFAYQYVYDRSVILTQALRSCPMFLHCTVKELIEEGVVSSLTGQSFRLINDSSSETMELTGLRSSKEMRILKKYYNKTVMNSIWGKPVDLFQAGARETKQWSFRGMIKADNLTVFAIDKLRVLQYEYESKMKYKGLKMRKFVLPKTVYQSCANYTPNCDYYQFWEDGLLNLTSSLSTPVPTFASKSYFLDAPYWVNEVNRKMGLRDPDPETDDTYMFIEPYTGAVFKGKLSYMISLRTFTTTSPYDRVREMLIPMYTLTVVGSAPDSIIRDLSNTLKVLKHTVQASKFAAPTLAVIALAIFVWVHFHTKSRDRKKQRKMAAKHLRSPEIPVLIPNSRKNTMNEGCDQSAKGVIVVPSKENHTPIAGVTNGNEGCDAIAQTKSEEMSTFSLSSRVIHPDLLRVATKHTLIAGCDRSMDDDFGVVTDECADPPNVIASPKRDTSGIDPIVYGPNTGETRPYLSEKLLAEHREIIDGPSTSEGILTQKKEEKPVHSESDPKNGGWMAWLLGVDHKTGAQRRYTVTAAGVSREIASDSYDRRVVESSVSVEADDIPTLAPSSMGYANASGATGSEKNSDHYRSESPMSQQI